MKTNSLKPCAVVLLMAPVILLAQKTQISVKKGTVVAQTADQTVTIDAGRRAVLAADKSPTVTVDNPLVYDAMQLHELIEQEKKRSDLKIDSAFIMVGTADVDRVVGALYFEFPNTAPQAMDSMTIGPSSIIGDFQVYDLNGNLCRVDVKLLDESSARYTVHLNEPVQPGELVRVIGVANLEDIPLIPGGAPAYWKEGPLWYFRTVNNIPNCLNYFRLILPKSAILIDSNRPIIATDCVGDKLAVTIRNYTGKYADGWCMISLLWPEHDGTSLADIPDEYHGLRDPRDRQAAETYRRELTQIFAGKQFQDQSTPLSALLTAFGAVIQKDLDRYLDAVYLAPAQDVEQRFEGISRWADTVDVLGIPELPRNPGDGYIHPIYLSRKGSLICEYTQICIYEDGKWYAYETRSRRKSPQDRASAEDIEAAKARDYLTDWEVAGPYTLKDREHTELFDIPFGPELPGTDVPWQPMPIEPLGQHPAYLNLDNALYGGDKMVGYLRTQIVSAEERPARLEIYSDDGVKAWLNGELVHTINIGRAIPDEPDKVAVTLKKGTNHLMLKVTDHVWSWGAIVRLRPVNVGSPEPQE
ncbi:MAG: hypothetical protein JSU70_05360 [Phycisphaerales bacterium]|nr:MAG: hypothetical protein JSU70_05360 [Phycisphaerales bacterium]